MKQLRNILVIMIAMVASVLLFQGRAAAAEYSVPAGTVYWESSYSGGTGRYSTISSENNYVSCSEEGDFPIVIDGYSILNQDGNILESSFQNGTPIEELPTVPSGTQMMLHIWSVKGYRLGWVCSTDLTVMNSQASMTDVKDGNEDEFLENVEEKEADEIVTILQEAIKEDESIPRKSYILGDLSGSMSVFHNEVLTRLEEEFEGEKYVFAGKMQKFSPGMSVYGYAIDGGSTDIANAFNALEDVEPNSHIYLLSDLQDNAGTTMKENRDFVGEITIIYYPDDDYYFYRFLKTLRKSFPNATVTAF